MQWDTLFNASLWYNYKKFSNTSTPVTVYVQLSVIFHTYESITLHCLRFKRVYTRQIVSLKNYY